MAQSGILTVSGSDRPGILDEISHFVLERGGQIADMRTVSLEGQFAFICRVHGNETAMTRIRLELFQLNQAANVHAVLHLSDGRHRTNGDIFHYKFIATGSHQTGALNKISHLLRVLNINIEDIDNRLGPGDDETGRTFELEMTLAIPRATPIAMINEYLKHLCEEMSVDWEMKQQ
jgi:glycine cleavage system transcriptional repressor